MSVIVAEMNEVIGVGDTGNNVYYKALSNIPALSLSHSPSSSEEMKEENLGGSSSSLIGCFGADATGSWLRRASVDEGINN